MGECENGEMGKLTLRVVFSTLEVVNLKKDLKMW